ncbi:MAG: UvrD-helicase domain-containing protein [Bacteroidales bacterium]|nr:UvrD-helicase domain-containing protein [Bacteroidales bacterium]
MLKILKASAGSGKTYNLAKEYIRLIVKSNQPDAYRHVLAVTFTNKATDEMKRRILKELHTLAKNPDGSKYLDYLIRETGLDKTTLQKRAQTQLSGILHDYSAFAVSTIDRFFQQTLRAFSREIGQFSTYQVQLDREELVQESVDRVLDSISENDKAVLNWLTDSARWDLEQKGWFSIEGRLRDMATSLGKLPDGERGLFSREKLQEIGKYCKEVRKAWEESVRKSARKVVDSVAACGLTTDDFNRKFLSSIHYYLDAGNGMKKPTEAFTRKALNPEEWFSKANARFLPVTRGMLEAPLEGFIGLFDAPYRVYQTADLILKQIYALGMASELAYAFQQIQKEKNVISIDDSNTILKSIIDGTDTPFIYEKLGVRFEDFLLDEFQDTSDIQWDNFRPLLHGSIDSGADSLVVGDVKQSIYRWRGSDWNLLGSRLEQEFSNPRIDPLKENWRTCREIVYFNNEFFGFAAKELGVQDLYADVEQVPKFSDPAPGSVDIVFTDNEMEEIFSTLETLRNSGALWADIAILVRGNDDGAAIAAELVARSIPVVSDDSLYVKASATVRRLVSQLSIVDTPQNQEKPSVAGYLASSMGINIPERYHSLTDLAESLLRDISASKPEVFNAEIPYIQSFMDYLQDWVSQNGNNLQAFLRAWAGADPKIASPQSGDSVRIMTVHKSKGLEFPYVIFPFAEKVNLYKHSSYWCRPDTEGTPLEGKAEGNYFVDLTDATADTLFKAQYDREHLMQTIDNINIFYVALTRPIYGLKVIAATPPASMSALRNMSQVLYLFTGGKEYSRGQLHDFSSIRREEKASSIIETGYASFPSGTGDRLKFSQEAADYFGEDGTYGPEASRRIRGNVLHGILSRVVVAHDIPAALEASVLSGDLPSNLKEEALSFLQSRISSVSGRGWFSPEARILSEESVLAPGEGEYRPDRVVIHPDGKVDIVDFKFGKEEKKYLSQVRRYMNLYRRMGFEKVDGYLWYLDDNLINFVAD